MGKVVGKGTCTCILFPKHFLKHAPLCNAQITTCFTSEDEKELTNLMVNFCWSGFPLSKNKLCRLAWEYANMNGITGFSARKEKAGHKWLKGFLRHYPQLKPKKAKNISVNRAMCANPITIGGFLIQYHQVCEKFNIISPMYIWNCDESGV